MTTLAEIIPVHPDKFFDLQTEPWIPVSIGGQQTHVGLRELLERAHMVEDFAFDNALASYSMTRYLLAVTLGLVASDRTFPWETVVRDGAPLPQPQIDRTLARLREHTWLLHPDTPFLQLPGMRNLICRDVPKGSTPRSLSDPYETMLPHLPAKNNEAWWYRPGTVGSPGPADVAVGLLVRHYTALAGNESPTLPSKKMRSEGGVVIPGAQPTTHVYWKCANLAATLVSNQLTADVTACTKDSVFFWEDPLAVAAHVADPLYRSTASGAASFVVPTGEEWRLLRSAVPVEVELAKALVTACRLRDPHVLRVSKDPTKQVLALNETSAIVFNPEASQFANVHAFYKKSASVSALRPCVLNTKLLAYRPAPGTTLRAVTVIPGGNATGARVDAVVSRDLDPTPMLLPDDRAASLRILLDRLGGPSKSLMSQLRYRIRASLSSGALDVAAMKGLNRRAELLVWDQLDRTLASLYEQVRTSPEPPEQLDEATKAEWVRAGAAALAAVCGPYESSPRLRARIVKNQAQFRRSTWTLL
jgi:hypothetical protein